MYVCKFLPSIQQTLHAQYELNITVVPKCLMYTRSFACFNLCCSFYIPYTGCLPAFSPHILQSTFICVCVKRPANSTKFTCSRVEIHCSMIEYIQFYYAFFFSSVSSMCSNHFNIILFLPALFFFSFVYILIEFYAYCMALYGFTFVLNHVQYACLLAGLQGAAIIVRDTPKLWDCV